MKELTDEYRNNDAIQNMLLHRLCEVCSQFRFEEDLN